MITYQQITEVLGEPVIEGVMGAAAQFRIRSNNVTQHDLFFALKGERSDGHHYLADVASRGGMAVVTKPDAQLTMTQWQVPNVLDAMTELTQCIRQSHGHIPVVAITGSCGKTTTTVLLHSIMQLSANVLVSEKSFNNHTGVPLTLSQLSNDIALVIQEMGANNPGEIAALCAMAKPDVALINNIEPVHLQGFGDCEGVAKAKAEIYQALSPNGIAVVNIDSDYANLFLTQYLQNKSVITFSKQSSQADMYLSNIHYCDATGSQFDVTFQGQTVMMQLPLLGVHNIENALAACACACAFNVSSQQMQQGLAQVKNRQHRMQVIQTEKNITILDDSYNANVVAVKKALDTLDTFNGRKFFVFADMAECGDKTHDFHEEVGRYVNQMDVARCYAFGEFVCATVQVLGEKAQHFSDQQSLIQQLKADLLPGDVVLIKGSNSMKLCNVVSALQ